jgi:hypothetical protein
LYHTPFAHASWQQTPTPASRPHAEFWMYGFWQFWIRPFWQLWLRLLTSHNSETGPESRMQPEMLGHV